MAPRPATTLLGLAKRPELLILDEPVASLGPLARREFLQHLMEAVAEHELSVVLSLHVVADLERVCDQLVVLVDSQLQVGGAVETLLDTHHRLLGPRRDPATLPANQQVISASHTDRPSTFVVRTSDPILDPAWTVSRLSLEDPVLGIHGPAPRHRAGSPARAGGPPMIWLTWRQFRAQAVTVYAAVAAFAVIRAITGPRLLELSRANPSTVFDQLTTTDRYLYNAGLVMLGVAPAVVGAYWGAPMVAGELEAGTHRLAWWCISPPTASGPFSGPKLRCSSGLPACWPGSASGGPAAG